MFTRCPASRRRMLGLGARVARGYALSLALAAGFSRQARGAEVRVQGQTEFSAIQVVTLERGTRVQGLLVDDLGKPVTGAEVRVATAAGVAPTQACASESGSAVPSVLHTDSSGAFCALFASAAPGETFRFTFPGSPLLEKATFRSQLRTAESSIELDLGSRPLQFDVGKVEHRSRRHPGRGNSPRTR
jgi:hypothetical protein